MDKKHGKKRKFEEVGESSTSTKVEDSFESLGLCPQLCAVCKNLGWTKPTEIQKKAIPLALAGKDIIGLAETGSGKTAAYVLPILQDLLKRPQRYFAMVLLPTRELAAQVASVFHAIGAHMNLKVGLIIGGASMESQIEKIAKKPHIIIATPGRLWEHLEETKKFTLRALKYLVLDEADKVLENDFEEEVNRVVSIIPSDRKTYLYSATMTDKLTKLQNVSLRDPVSVEIGRQLDSLVEFFVFSPQDDKKVYLLYLINELIEDADCKSIMVFCKRCEETEFVAMMLSQLGFSALALNGKQRQNQRIDSLTKFRAKSKKCILVTTDLASRGLDIQQVDVVINYDVPEHAELYVHRVGRTARAGRRGQAFTLVDERQIKYLQNIETFLGKRLTEYETDRDIVMILEERTKEAERLAQSIFQRRRHKSGLNKAPKILGDDLRRNRSKGHKKKLSKKKGRKTKFN